MDTNLEQERTEMATENTKGANILTTDSEPEWPTQMNMYFEQKD
jgi:hypothetical protein